MEQIMVIVHVLGATIWTGGHLVLSLTVLPRALRERDPEIIRAFEAGYEKLGIPALIAQVVTGLWLARNVLPAAEWFRFDSPIGGHIAAKFILLGLTVALALHARLRVLPNLDEKKLKALAWHIVPVTILSVLFVVMGVGVRFLSAAAQ